MPHYNIDLRATARLPGLDVEVVHRRSPAGDRDEISISVQAVPFFGAVGSVLYAVNPFVFWAEATRLTWLEAARALMLPSNAAPTLQKSGSNVVPFSKRGKPRCRHADDRIELNLLVPATKGGVGPGNGETDNDAFKS